MDKVKELSAVAALLITLSGVILGVQKWMDLEYAKQEAVAEQDRQAALARLNIIAGQVRENINQDSAWAAHYRRLENEGLLTPAQRERLDNLDRALERQYRQAEWIDQALIESGLKK